MDKKDVFKNFLETNEVLIVDKNATSRSRLIKTMSDLGAKNHRIHSASNIDEANLIIEQKSIGLVLSEYYIGSGSGFDLFKSLRKRYPNNKELCLILVTANISQSAVARAAEEDVDTFIIKPYTAQSIQEGLLSTVYQKVKPSDYIKKVEEGKNQITNGQYTEAEVTLNEAVKMNSKPSLALFYLGQAAYLKRHVELATGSYSQGISFNNIHYKCLVGLYEIFIEDQKFHEAYQIVRKISKYFPANPDRLSEIVRLAIRTENFQDMQDYYEMFISLEERIQSLTNYLGAGMFIAGKHCLLNGTLDTAFKYFDNIATSCSVYTKFLRAIVEILVEQDMVDYADKYLRRFEATDRNGIDYKVSEYLVFAKSSKDDGAIIKNGLDLYNGHIKNILCMQALIEAMERSSFNPEKILSFKKEMEKLTL